MKDKIKLKLIFTYTFIFITILTLLFPIHTYAKGNSNTQQIDNIHEIYNYSMKYYLTIPDIYTDNITTIGEKSTTIQFSDKVYMSIKAHDYYNELLKSAEDEIAELKKQIIKNTKAIYPDPLEDGTEVKSKLTEAEIEKYLAQINLYEIKILELNAYASIPRENFNLDHPYLVNTFNNSQYMKEYLTNSVKAILKNKEMNTFSKTYLNESVFWSTTFTNKIEFQPDPKDAITQPENAENGAVATDVTTVTDNKTGEISVYVNITDGIMYIITLNSNEDLLRESTPIMNALYSLEIGYRLNPNAYYIYALIGLIILAIISYLIYKLSIIKLEVYDKDNNKVTLRATKRTFRKIYAQSRPKSTLVIPTIRTTTPEIRPSAHTTKSETNDLILLSLDELLNRISAEEASEIRDSINNNIYVLQKVDSMLDTLHDKYGLDRRLDQNICNLSESDELKIHEIMKNLDEPATSISMYINSLTVTGNINEEYFLKQQPITTNYERIVDNPLLEQYTNDKISQIKTVDTLTSEYTLSYKSNNIINKPDIISSYANEFIASIIDTPPSESKTASCVKFDSDNSISEYASNELSEIYDFEFYPLPEYNDGKITFKTLVLTDAIMKYTDICIRNFEWFLIL